MMRRLSAILAATATFGGSWAVGMALAEPPDPRIVLSDVGSSALTSFEVDDLYPGQAVTHPIVVSLTPTAPDARLAIEIGGLEDLERGCNRDERHAGDTTCGEHGGELSQQLYLSAVLAATSDCDDLTGAAQVLQPQPLQVIAGAGLIDLTDELITGGGSRCLVMTIDLPRAADNLVQSDLSRFDMTVHAEQALPDQDVAGEQLGPDDDQQVLGAADRRGVIPAAGLAAAGLLALGGGSVAAGTWLVRTTRRRGRDDA